MKDMKKSKRLIPTNNDKDLYIPDDPMWPLGEAFMDTHYYSVDLPYARWKPAPKAFAKGWKTHNEIWGADFYAHGPVYIIETLMVATQFLVITDT
jgi:hypothetical protein